MWRNADVLDFVGWLRAFNDAMADPTDAVGFYGVDLYSPFTSIEAVIRYLEDVDPEARSARKTATVASITSARKPRPTATRPRSGSRIRARTR